MSDTPSSPDQALPAGEPRSEAAILADPRLRELLTGYQPLHHDLFLKSYARLLAELHQHGALYEENLEYLLHQHDKEAYKHLWLIQHQKLFDLECQWRAGLVEVPGARLTADFEDWHEYIEECRAVPPISSEELALLDAYLAQLTDPRDLLTGNPSTTFWLHRRFPRLAEEDADEEELTGWTTFWDLHRGCAHLRALPDLRGEQEHRYQRAYYDAQRDPNPPPPAPEDPRPHVPTYGPEYDDLVRELLRRFEPAAALRRFETKRELEAYDASEDRLDLPLALERLQNAGPVLVPIQAHADWRQAIIEAGNQHYLGQLRAALPHVYEQYCQRESLGIRHAPAADRYRFHKRGRHYKADAKIIRKGRRLLGEADDTDF
jgi:hypothetical protein